MPHIIIYTTTVDDANPGSKYDKMSNPESLRQFSVKTLSGRFMFSPGVFTDKSRTFDL